VSYPLVYPADVSVPINQIRELRLGQPPNDAALTSSRWITIVYVRGKEWKILHMISLTDDVHDHWIDTLRTLVAETSDRAVAEIKPSDPDLIWIRQLWPAGSSTIDMGTAVGLCRSIGLAVPKGLQEGYKVSLHMFYPGARADMSGPAEPIRLSTTHQGRPDPARARCALRSPLQLRTLWPSQGRAISAGDAED
jgi:hypothetical protein